MDGPGVLTGSVGSRSSRHPGWPAELGPLPSPAGDVMLRPLHRRDGTAWRRLRVRDQPLIERWDASSPLRWSQRHSPVMWRSQRSLLAAAARQGASLPFAITVGGAFAGQVTLGGIQRGAVRSGWIGYWVDSQMHGSGVATAAVGLAVAHALGPVGLHRVEATIAPDNAASRAVAQHIGMREEGVLLRYLDIAGAWRDHVLYALTVEELGAGHDSVVARVDRYLRHLQGPEQEPEQERER